MFYFPHFDINIFHFYILEIKKIQEYTVEVVDESLWFHLFFYLNRPTDQTSYTHTFITY